MAEEEIQYELDKLCHKVSQINPVTFYAESKWDTSKEPIPKTTTRGMGITKGRKEDNPLWSLYESKELSSGASTVTTRTSNTAPPHHIDHVKRLTKTSTEVGESSFLDSRVVFNNAMVFPFVWQKSYNSETKDSYKYSDEMDEVWRVQCHGMTAFANTGTTDHSFTGVGSLREKRCFSQLCGRVGKGTSALSAMKFRRV